MPSLAGANVLVVGINYAPEPTGIAPYTTGVAEELARHARSVTVLAGLPHYPSWTVPQAYRRRRRTEEPHEPGRPRVIRLAHYVPSTQSALRRALYEITFLVHVLWTAWRLTRRTRFDLVVTATPSLGGAVAAARIAQRLDVPLLTIVQDLMAKATAQSGISGGGAVTKTTARLEGYALRRATRVAVVSDSFRTTVAGLRRGRRPNRTAAQLDPRHAQHAVDRDEARRRLGWDTDEFIVAHTGNIGLKQDLGTVVEAARLLTDEPDLARAHHRRRQPARRRRRPGQGRSDRPDAATPGRRAVPARARRRRRAARQRTTQRRRHVPAQQAHLLPGSRPARCWRRWPRTARPPPRSPPATPGLVVPAGDPTALATTLVACGPTRAGGCGCPWRRTATRGNGSAPTPRCAAWPPWRARPPRPNAASCAPSAPTATTRAAEGSGRSPGSSP